MPNLSRTPSTPYLSGSSPIPDKAGLYVNADDWYGLRAWSLIAKLNYGAINYKVLMVAVNQLTSYEGFYVFDNNFQTFRKVIAFPTP